MEKDKFEICRTCLVGILDPDSVVSITSTEITSMEPNILKLFLFFTADLKGGETLPRRICTVCYENLLSVNDFYKICLESQLFLEKVEKPEKSQSHIETVDGIEIIEEASSDPIGINSNVCDKCEEVFYTSKQLSEHQLLVHPSLRPHKCNVCNQTFKYDFNLNTHLRTHNPNLCPYDCKICGKTFSIRGTYLAHLVEHNGNRPFHCDTCGSAFLNKSSLIAHMQDKHCEGEEEVPTPPSDNLPKEETKEKSKDPPKHQCPHCKKTFSKNSHLKIHIDSIHLKAKPHHCEICGKGFARSGDKKIHMQRHSGVKPFKCEYCSMTFVRRNALSTHLRVHVGGTPYTCKMCGEKFKNYYALKVHKSKSHFEETFPGLESSNSSESEMSMNEDTDQNPLTEVHFKLETDEIDHNQEDDVK